MRSLNVPVTALVLSSVALLGTLAGCATQAPIPAQEVAVRSYRPAIEMTGRMSAQYEANYREQSVSSRFTWTQNGDRIGISLESPTGQTVSAIEISADQATMRQGDRPPRSAADVNALTTEVLGWPLPVAGLRDWLQGYLDSSHQIAIGPDDNGQAHQVDGWTLHYVSWSDDGRPKRIDLTRYTEQAGQVNLRIVVDAWDSQ